MIGRKLKASAGTEQRSMMPLDRLFLRIRSSALLTG